MKTTLSAFIAGLVFGTGLIVSGMTNPMKVQNFLDVAGIWDPSLAFVMGAGLAVTIPGFALIRRRYQPVFAGRFHWPTKTDIDARLLTGAAIFGIGWGLAGFCPGPALTALPTLWPEIAAFVAAMIAGLWLADAATARAAGRAAPGNPTREEGGTP